MPYRSLLAVPISGGEPLADEPTDEFNNDDPEGLVVLPARERLSGRSPRAVPGVLGKLGVMGRDAEELIPKDPREGEVVSGPGEARTPLDEGEGEASVSGRRARLGGERAVVWGGGEAVGGIGRCVGEAKAPEELGLGVTSWSEEDESSSASGGAASDDGLCAAFGNANVCIRSLPAPELAEREGAAPKANVFIRSPGAGREGASSTLRPNENAFIRAPSSVGSRAAGGGGGGGEGLGAGAGAPTRLLGRANENAWNLRCSSSNLDVAVGEADIGSCCCSCWRSCCSLVCCAC